jgi:biotin carboxyl carrier protein
MRYVAMVGGRRVTIELESNSYERRIIVDGTPLDVDWQQFAGAPPGLARGSFTGRYSLLINHRSYELCVRYIERENGALRYEVILNGVPYDVQVEDEREQALAGLTTGVREAGDMPVKAPMPGLVVNLPLQIGEQVERGGTVVVLEAMKMENDLPAPRSGIVKELRVTPGQAVNQGQILAIIGD